MTMQKHYFIIVFKILFGILCTDAFEIIKSSPSTSAKIGSKVTLSCESDEAYEYCDWWLGEVDPQNPQNTKYCKFEWKSNVKDVRQQNCNIADKAHFDGDYELNECKLVLKNVETSDSGIWTCRMEKYASIGRGTSRNKQLKLEVGSSTNTRQGTNK